MLDVPEALEHELEEGRLDPTGLILPGHDAPSTQSVLDPPRCNLIEHGLDELGLGAVRLLLPSKLVEALQWTHDGGAGGDAIEMIEP